METLRTYLNALPDTKRAEFAQRCRTSVNYLRKAISLGQPLRESLCIDIERESAGAVKVEELRTDVDWNYIRGTRKRKAS